MLYENQLFQMCDFIFVSAEIFIILISPTFCEPYISFQQLSTDNPLSYFITVIL